MKKYAGLYAVLTLTVLIGFIMSSLSQKLTEPQAIDFVAMNEIAKQAALCWQSPEELSRFGFAYRYLIIDNNGVTRYASDNDLPESLSSAVMNGYVPIDIVAGASIVGKALIETAPEKAQRQRQIRLYEITFAVFALSALLNFAFLAALHNALIKPFTKLQSFAHKITAGQFDEPLPMDKNNIFGLYTQSFDIMRESLLTARKNQTRTEREKKELIASLSHDIKTPVTSIRLISELLQTETEDSRVKEKLQTIEKKAGQIDRLMNNMLHSALEELGELSVNLANENSAVLKSLFENADHLSKIRLSEIPVCLIEIDRVRMEQIIGNIIENSYKYAGTNIDVDFAVRGELLQADISDYGKGVNTEELELITTKFYRGENAKASYKEGEGLGLHIAKLLMDKMGGSLETFNRGDGFTVRLWIRLSR